MGFGLRDQGLGFRVQGSGSTFGTWTLGVTVWLVLRHHSMNLLGALKAVVLFWSCRLSLPARLEGLAKRGGRRLGFHLRRSSPSPEPLR